jgi:hypothetical protein
VSGAKATTAFGGAPRPQSATTRFGIRSSFTLDSSGHQDPRYFRSGEGAPVGRASYACRETFVGHTDSGKKTLPWVRFAATYGVAFLANSWNPDRLSDNRHAVVRGTVTLAADAGNNIFDEFWPDIKKKFFNHKREPTVTGVAAQAP